MCGRAGILTSCPSATPFGFALGPPNPWLIAIAKETLGFWWAGLSPALRLLMPTFSLLLAPPFLSGRLRCQEDAPLSTSRSARENPKFEILNSKPRSITRYCSLTAGQAISKFRICLPRTQIRRICSTRVSDFDIRASNFLVRSTRLLIFGTELKPRKFSAQDLLASKLLRTF